MSKMITKEILMDYVTRIRTKLEFDKKSKLKNILDRDQYESVMMVDNQNALAKTVNTQDQKRILQKEEDNCDMSTITDLTKHKEVVTSCKNLIEACEAKDREIMRLNNELSNSVSLGNRS